MKRIFWILCVALILVLFVSLFVIISREARTTHDLARYRDDIESFATSDQKTFNAKIRGLLEKN